IPDDFPVRTEEFVSGDLHVHRPRVDFSQTAAVGADRPDAVHFVPRTRCRVADSIHSRGGSSAARVPNPSTQMNVAIETLSSMEWLCLNSISNHDRSRARSHSHLFAGRISLFGKSRSDCVVAVGLSPRNKWSDRITY